MTTVKHKVHFKAGKRSKKMMAKGAKPVVPPVERVPRIARLMALAIKFDQMIQSGQVRDQAELSRLGHVSRARMTQIMNLLNLAPDIQEEILGVRPENLPAIPFERRLRELTGLLAWEVQREGWNTIASEKH